MTAVIPDGIYTIANVQYGSYLDLYEGLRDAAIISWPQSQNWIVTNVGNQQITLETVSGSGAYAGACAISKAAPLYGTSPGIRWTPEKVSPDVYRLKAGNFYMCLPASGKLVTIFLAPEQGTPAGELQWKFNKV